MPQIFSNKRQASRPLQKTQTEHKALMQAKMYLVKVHVSEVTESKLHTYWGLRDFGQVTLHSTAHHGTLSECKGTQISKGDLTTRR